MLTNYRYIKEELTAFECERVRSVGGGGARGKAALLQLHHFFVELLVLHQRSMVIPSTSVHLLPLLALQPGLQVTLAGLCFAWPLLAPSSLDEPPSPDCSA